MNEALVELIIAGLLVGGVYSLVGMGFVLISKATGVINFAHGAILMLAALIGWFMIDAGLPAWLAILLTLVASGLLGYTAERLCLRPLIGQPLLSSVIITLALAWLLRSFFVLASGYEQQKGFPPLFPSGSLEVANINISAANAWNFGIAITLFAIFAIVFKYTKAGLAMRATAEDQEVAKSLGVNVTGVFSQVWIIAALTGGIAGMLLGSSTVVSLGLEGLGWKGLVVILLGGLDSLVGCIIAGPLIGVLENLCGVYIDPLIGGGVKEIAPFIIMILILIFRPYGLFGMRRIERI